jgi:hypothetical protein
MKVFLISCLAAVVLMVAAPYILRYSLPLSSQQAYTVGGNVRLSDSNSVTTDAD